MTEEQYIGKIAKDKKGRKLGKIVKIEDLTGKTIKKEIPHAMIRVRKFMKEDILVPIELGKIIEIKNNAVLFELLKEEFDKEVAKIRLLREQQELYDGKSPLGYDAKVRSYLSPMAGKLPEVKSRKK